ncbi:MAG TPA: alpha/beta hydrolase-fold protein, partial [Chitinophagaceae bacterium]|nr:alpha/beta hydrolase-fold protein [Chitinophagaceae bacterium]
MVIDNVLNVLLEQNEFESVYLKRTVLIDFYLPKNIEDPSELSLLLINDGQDLVKMDFLKMIDDLQASNQIKPLFCVGLHASKERRMEYGTARILDYEGRGAKAAAYNQFIIEELLPYIKETYKVVSFKQKAFAGFSLGGLTAIDVVWHYPHLFSIAGVFSGSLWWRSKSLDDGYNEDTDRIMHHQIRNGKYYPGLKFFFTTGSQDEVMDRNNNGIIDSIDDTLG